MKNKSTVKNSRDIGIITRPAGNGYYLSILPVLCHSVNVWGRDKLPVDLAYKRSTILCFGLFLQSLAIFLSLQRRASTRLATTLPYTTCNAGFTGFLFWVCLKDNVGFSLASAAAGVVLYDIVYFRVLRQMPKCFTLGEASIVCQGLVVFLYNAFLKVPKLFLNDRAPAMATQLSLIVQIILLGTIVVITLCHFVKFLRKTFLFWLLAIAVMGGATLFPIFGQPALVVVVRFILNEPQRMQIVSLYLAMLLLTSVFVVWRIQKSTSANTTTRKIFHLLIVLVYLPGLWYQCTILYVGSGFMLALLLLLETCRIVKLAPIYGALDKAVACFIDEKDAGAVALTPIFLLVGCAMPLWIHPVPCDLTDSAGLDLLKLMAGVLSVGIGDTMASVCGYYLGRHRWPGSVKSVEGTLGCVLGQVATIYALFHFRFVQLNTLKAATAGVAIIVNSLIEARTDQVDNLVLPFVTYIILGTA
uniref:dolichol kinase n=1 Tax=Culex tarsalis TaxID=7177 RepID=A0A1Q3FCU4_CULTA